MSNSRSQVNSNFYQIANAEANCGTITGIQVGNVRTNYIEAVNGQIDLLLTATNIISDDIILSLDLADTGVLLQSGQAAQANTLLIQNIDQTPANVVAGYYFGDGSQLTGINAGNLIGAYSNANVANYLPVYGGNIAADRVTANFVLVNGNIVAAGGIVGSEVDANLGRFNNANITSNVVTGGYYFGNGAFLTGLPEAYGNANVANYLPVYGGNILFGNLLGANSGETALYFTYPRGDGEYNTKIEASDYQLRSNLANLNNSNLTYTSETVDIIGSGIIFDSRDIYWANGQQDPNAYVAGGGFAAGGFNVYNPYGDVRTYAALDITQGLALQSLTPNTLPPALKFGSSPDSILPLGDPNAQIRLNVGEANAAQASAQPANLTIVKEYLSTDTGLFTIAGPGNVSAGYYYGNGAFLTGITASGGNYSNANVANYLPVYGGNALFNQANANVIMTGTSLGNVRISGGQIRSSILGDVATLDADLLTITAGNPTIWLRSYNNAPQSIAANNLQIVTEFLGNQLGNLTANYYYGNGRFLTGIDTSTDANAVRGVIWSDDLVPWIDNSITQPKLYASNQQTPQANSVVVELFGNYISAQAEFKNIGLVSGTAVEVNFVDGTNRFTGLYAGDGTAPNTANSIMTGVTFANRNQPFPAQAVANIYQGYAVGAGPYISPNNDSTYTIAGSFRPGTGISFTPTGNLQEFTINSQGIDANVVALIARETPDYNFRDDIVLVAADNGGRTFPATADTTQWDTANITFATLLENADFVTDANLVFTSNNYSFQDAESVFVFERDGLFSITSAVYANANATLGVANRISSGAFNVKLGSNVNAGTYPVYVARAEELLVTDSGNVVRTLNGLEGDLSLVAGQNIIIATPSSNVIAISANVGGAGGSGATIYQQALADDIAGEAFLQAERGSRAILGVPMGADVTGGVIQGVTYIVSNSMENPYGFGMRLPTSLGGSATPYSDLTFRITQPTFTNVTIPINITGGSGTPAFYIEPVLVNASYWTSGDPYEQAAQFPLTAAPASGSEGTNFQVIHAATFGAVSTGSGTATIASISGGYWSVTIAPNTAYTGTNTDWIVLWVISPSDDSGPTFTITGAPTGTAFLNNGDIEVDLTIGTGGTTAVPGLQQVLLANNQSNLNIITTGNISANYYTGNGSLLTGVSNYSNANVAAYLPQYGGNIAIDQVTANVGNTRVDITGNSIILGNSETTSDVVIFDTELGVEIVLTSDNANNYARHTPQVSEYIYSGPGNLTTTVGRFGNNAYGLGISNDTGNILIGPGNIDATGNVTANYYYGNGAFLTGIASSGNNEPIANAVIATTNAPMGFDVKDGRDRTSIAFNNSTRTFTITPSANTNVWVSGQRYYLAAETSQQIQIANTAGSHYISYDATGTLVEALDYFDLANVAPVSIVYWQPSTATAQLVLDERHTTGITPTEHEYLHTTRGAVVQFVPSVGFVITANVGGTGSNNADAQVSISSGTIWDEDIQINIVNTATPAVNSFQQNLSQLPVLYRVGSTEWHLDAATAFPLKQGTARPTYNLNTAGVWTTPDVDNNDFIVQWICATNAINTPVVSIMGQDSYNTLNQAQAATFADLNLSGLPLPELRPLYGLVFQGSNSYTNTPHARLRSFSDVRLELGVTASVSVDAVDVEFRETPQTVFANDAIANAAWNNYVSNVSQVATVTWLDYVTRWDTAPVILGNAVANFGAGNVGGNATTYVTWQGDTIYRFVPQTYTATQDSFWSNVANISNTFSVSNIITTRAS